MENMKEKKYIPAFFAKAMLLAFFTYCLTPALALAECNGRVPLCSEANSCHLRTTNKNSSVRRQGKQFAEPATNKINSDCVRKESANGCFNSTPVSYVGSGGARQPKS